MKSPPVADQPCSVLLWERTGDAARVGRVRSHNTSAAERFEGWRPPLTEEAALSIAALALAGMVNVVHSSARRALSSVGVPVRCGIALRLLTNHATEPRPSDGALSLGSALTPSYWGRRPD
jgi:hypothetical protein